MVKDRLFRNDFTAESPHEGGQASPESSLRCPHLYTIDAAKPFVDVLACWLLGHYGEGRDWLASVVLLVPTRRAVGSLRQALLQHSGGRPLLLPRIYPLDAADFELLAPELFFGANADPSLLATPISPTKRTLALSGLVEAYFRKLGGEEFLADQSVLLAQSLGDLIDDLERAQIDFGDLHKLVPQEYAEHWQKTLDFLDIVGKQWPEMRREFGSFTLDGSGEKQVIPALDAVARRNRLLLALSEHWRAAPPGYPIIAAGTTGSIPATATLLETIAGLPEGRVILPGLDCDSPGEEWDAIGPSHPQYGLKRLLGHFGCDRGGIERLNADRIEGAPAERMQLIAASMLPAEFSGRWRELEIDAEKAMARMAMIEFDHDEAEATAIALMLREALEHPEHRAMLVTHDRSLAQRVSIRLARWGVACEDGGGIRLSETRAASLLFALLDFMRDETSPVSLLTLLKHPLCALGSLIGERLGAISLLEMRLLRGVRPGMGLQSMAELLQPVENATGAIGLLDSLDAIVDPLRRLFARPFIALGELQDALIDAASAIAQLPEDPGGNLLWSGGDGRQLSLFLAEIGRDASVAGPIRPDAFAGILRSLLSRQTYHPLRSSHPRLAILSPIEARMQHADLLIMAGLNEECWPPAAPDDPWMSRPMRERAGLEPHERIIGLSAHDFYSLAAAPRIVLTRARKVGESPRLASRWWQRLSSVIEAIGASKRPSFQDEANKWRSWAAEAEKAVELPRLLRPNPQPPLKARPRRFTLSDIEKLLDDPYALYAHRILQLKPLDPLDKEPGAAEFGTAIHRALSEFFTGPLPALDAASEQRLSFLIENALKDALRQPALPVFWRRRAGLIVSAVMRGEAERRALIRSTASEVTFTMACAAPGGAVEIEGRLDRLDRLHDGTCHIIDYKTGAAPTHADVESGRKPQLPLEGALLEANGESASALLYWSFALAGMGISSATGKQSAGQLIAEARKGLHELIARYDDPASTYPALGDQSSGRHKVYAHLERASEW